MTMNDDVTARRGSNMDPDHDLRLAIAGVNKELAGLSNVTGLLASWGTLMKLLDVRPAPELRDCPVCGNVGMRAASRCGRCWAKLDAPPHLPRPRIVANRE
jgi:hypothetical protein